jgi:hypothetical protein
MFRTPAGTAIHPQNKGTVDQVNPLMIGRGNQKIRVALQNVDNIGVPQDDDGLFDRQWASEARAKPRPHARETTHEPSVAQRKGHGTAASGWCPYRFNLCGESLSHSQSPDAFIKAAH